MNWLMFELAAPLASYGSVAPGPVRDTELLPSRAAVLGMLAAALGIERDEAHVQRELGHGLLVATRANADAVLQRDYHTAQAATQAALKGRPCATRHDELRVPKDDLNTVLSDRYYYANYAATIGINSDDEVKLEGLSQALRSPRFTLFLGRKSCAPAWPLDPHCVSAITWSDALALHDERAQIKIAAFRRFGVENWLRSGRYVHGGDQGINPGDLEPQVRTLSRWDEPIDTALRLFAMRSHWRVEQGSTP